MKSISRSILRFFRYAVLLKLSKCSIPQIHLSERYDAIKENSETFGLPWVPSFYSPISVLMCRTEAEGILELLVKSLSG